MLSIEVSLNIMTLLAIILFAVLSGYILKLGQIKKKHLKIQELRKEIVWNHAQILELEKECATLESKAKTTKTPVLSLKPSSKDFPEENQRVSEGNR